MRINLLFDSFMTQDERDASLGIVTATQDPQASRRGRKNQYWRINNIKVFSVIQH